MALGILKHIWSFSILLLLLIITEDATEIHNFDAPLMSRPLQGCQISSVHLQYKVRMLRLREILQAACGLYYKNMTIVNNDCHE